MMYEVVMDDQMSTELGMSVFPVDQLYWYHAQLKCIEAEFLLKLILSSNSQQKFLHESHTGCEEYSRQQLKWECFPFTCQAFSKVCVTKPLACQKHFLQQFVPLTNDS